MQAKFEELIEGYVTGNIGISEAFLNVALCKALQTNLMRLKRDSRLGMAGTGKSQSRDKTQPVLRSDKTSWLDNNSKNDAEREFLDTIKEFMAHLNATCYTGLNTFEFHYALYEEGTFYSRHRDQLRNDYNRKFSFISYLNEDWIATDGGQLLIHTDAGTQEILPNNQKAIFFKSDELEHEVAIALRPRMSVTGWLKRV
jgi:SM-20-related protein